MKTIFVGLFLLVAAVQTSTVAQAYDCAAVRAYVAQYGVRAALAWARGQGYSAIEIALVRASCFRRS